MQRLKGLTTGAMPTFIDISKNFESSEITEDNLINQTSQNGKSITFMGDDTWVSLYAKHLNRSFPYPSFNVKDLHTVDDGILSHLVPELTSPNQDWDIIIAHFLGVDHVGHRYESGHPTMETKLLQMNKMIEEVVAVLPQDTLLLVMGDHGSTDDGNHGGASEEELNAALFIHSSRQFHCSGTQSSFPTISQIDLVPSLSLLLGVPIPFGNIGGIIPELFECKSGQDKFQSMKESVFSYHLNCWQIFNYLVSYSKVSSEFPKDRMRKLTQLFDETNQQFITTVRSKQRTQEAMNQLLRIKDNYSLFQQGVKEMCTEMWVRFDVTSMMCGVAVLALSLLCHALYQWHPQSPSKNFVQSSCALSVIASLSLQYFAETDMFSSTVIGASIGTELAFIATTCQHLPIMDLVKSFSFENLASTLFLLLHGTTAYNNIITYLLLQGLDYFRTVLLKQKNRL